MSGTVKLYYTDSFMRTFDALVLSCEETKNGCIITLDRTAFYPEGGGQPADTGLLGGVTVTDVREQDGIIRHTCSGPLAAGSSVTGEIDWARRFGFMQQHSGEHILSGFLHSMYGLENVGFHMGAEAVTIDTSAVISDEQLERAERAANEYISRSPDVRVLWPSADELASLAYRSKKELTGAVRIVEFPGADVCACCGTHVHSAGQAGPVKILSAVKFRSGLRLEILCGLRALEYLSRVYSGNSRISQALSAKPLDTSAAVLRTLDALAAEKSRAAGLEQRLCAYRAAEFRGCGDVLIFEDGLSPDAARRLADSAAGESGGLAAVFVESESGGFRYAAAKRGSELTPLAKAMNSAISGRGGGRGGLIQGSVAASRADIESFFEKYMNFENRA